MEKNNHPDSEKVLIYHYRAQPLPRAERNQYLLEHCGYTREDVDYICAIEDSVGRDSSVSKGLTAFFERIELRMLRVIRAKFQRKRKSTTLPDHLESEQ